MDLTRTIVIGNSGAGKSWLSKRIANHLCAPWVDLDLIHWQPGGYDLPRSREDALELVRQAAASESWVIEGVYGWLVRDLLPRATTLLWLCTEEAECVANIRQRGLRRGGSEESFHALLAWAGSYRAREGSTSHCAHAHLFDAFGGSKLLLHNKDEATAFASFAQSTSNG